MDDEEEELEEDELELLDSELDELDEPSAILPHSSKLPKRRYRTWWRRVKSANPFLNSFPEGNSVERWTRPHRARRWLI